MEVKILNKEEIDKIVADKIAKGINRKLNYVLGLATGSTPIGVYENLVKLYKQNKVSFDKVTTFNLDEYVGLEGEHDQSYRYFMNKHLFDGTNIDKSRTFFPDNKTKTPQVYDEQIKNAGGIDLQVLGIGSNGHIGFNEPNTPFDSLTHVVQLTESTIRDNSRFFASIREVPTSAVSMGLKTIMEAREIVLIATGSNKAEAIAKLVKNEPNVALPASVLKTHPNVTIYCDELAGSLL